MKEFAPFGGGKGVAGGGVGKLFRFREHNFSEGAMYTGK